MKRVGVIAAIIYVTCLMMPFMHEGSLHAMAEDGPRLTAEQAIAAARRDANAKPDSKFTILREIVANADTRRTGDQALEQAKAHKVELYENGLLANILRAGGFLLAETDPRTNYVIKLHIVLLESGGAVKDLRHECHGDVSLADAGELVKDTAEFVEQLYSTPSTEDSSLASRYYGGTFPDGDQFPGTLFAIPNSLRRLGANSNEVREAAALYGGYNFWSWRYALSMPVYAASPVTALNAAEHKENALTKEFLQSNHMDPGLDLDLENIRSKTQLQERISLLKRLNKFLEEALKNDSDPTIVRANLSIVMMPLGVDVDLSQDEGQYVSSTPSMLMFLWHRLASGGFAVKMIAAG
jgi:hypothetical protein